MSFETDKKRLQFIKNREIENQFKAERQKIQDSLINRDVKKLSPNHSTFKRHRNLTVDWQPMTQAVFNGDSDPDTQYIDWEVVLERFDERFIPFINVEVLTRVSDGSINDGANIETPDKIVVFELEDLPSETYIKKLTIRASYHFSDGDVYLPYEAKLLITFSHYQDNLRGKNLQKIQITLECGSDRKYNSSMAFDEEKFERDMEKTEHILAIREAFLTMEGDFECVDIFNYIRKKELTEQIPIDNIVDALEKFRGKGELKLVKETPPRKYRRIINPE